MTLRGFDLSELAVTMAAWRRDFHAAPELAFAEMRTSAKIAETLAAFGLETHSGIARTGVVGVLDFGPGPSVGFRADMDALPIREATGLAYASQREGVMHACGHDGHMAMLLGAAKALSKRRDLCGRVVFIFQPAEENEGGARAMLDDGLFERFPVDAVYGLHNLPGVPVGAVMARAGAVSAAFDTFDIRIRGRGGHGAMPETARDPVVAAATLISMLNTIVSRNIRPLDAAVVTIGKVHAGATYNVIPDEAELKGSCRSFTDECRNMLRMRIIEACEGVGAACGVDIACDYRERYPSVVNTARENALLVDALSADPDVFTVIEDFEPLMGSEDFAFFLQERPGAYFILGAGECGGGLHTPTYDFNDEALSVGVRIWIRLAERLLRRS